MRRLPCSWVAIAVFLVGGVHGRARATEPIVDGYLEMVGPQQLAYIAAPVTTPPEARLASVRIALSGGYVASRVLLAPDTAGVPDLQNAASIADNAGASETGWVEITIPEQGRPSGNGWVVIEAPPATEPGETDRGVAYSSAPPADPALCGDGENEWGRLTGITLAVEPTFETVAGLLGKGGASAVVEELRQPVFLGVWPNPTHDTTTFRFIQVVSGTAQVDIFDVRGRRVQSVGGSVLPPGQHALTWNARTDHGSRVAHGTYFARLTAPGLVTSVRVLLLP